MEPKFQDLKIQSYQRKYIESYFKILPINDCVSLFKFRTANHKFPIETGRWDGTPLYNRKCNLCLKDKVGSEQHYLLECDFFLSQRLNCLQNLDSANSHFDREHFFSTLMNSTSENTLKSLCKLIKIILAAFRQLIKFLETLFYLKLSHIYNDLPLIQSPTYYLALRIIIKTAFHSLQCYLQQRT